MNSDVGNTSSQPSFYKPSVDMANASSGFSIVTIIVAYCFARNNDMQL